MIKATSNILKIEGVEKKKPNDTYSIIADIYTYENVRNILNLFMIISTLSGNSL